MAPWMDGLFFSSAVFKVRVPSGNGRNQKEKVEPESPFGTVEVVIEKDRIVCYDEWLCTGMSRRQRK